MIEYFCFSLFGEGHRLLWLCPSFFVSMCNTTEPCFVPIKKRVFGNFAVSKNK